MHGKSCEMNLFNFENPNFQFYHLSTINVVGLICMLLVSVLGQTNVQLIRLMCNDHGSSDIFLTNAIGRIVGIARRPGTRQLRNSGR